MRLSPSLSALLALWVAASSCDQSGSAATDSGTPGADAAVDAGLFRPDSGTLQEDGGAADGGLSDGGLTDSGVSDAGSSDAGTSDGGITDAGYRTPCGTLTDAGITATDFCTPDCWCWESPLPQGNGLNNGWALPDGGVWAIGDNGTAIQWAGGRWLNRSTGTSVSLRLGCLVNSDDIWASDTLSLFHWDGGSWVSVPYPVLDVGNTFVEDLWGVQGDDVWALVGNGAVRTLIRWNGAQWTAMQGPSTLLYGLWGISSTDLWSSDGMTNAYHWDGGSWVAVPFPPGLYQPIQRITGSSSSDVWFSGNPDDEVHWNGTQMTLLPMGVPLASVWAISPSEAWATSGGRMLHWDGGAWSATNALVSGTTNAVFGSAPNNGWAVGEGGELATFDGGSWALATSGIDVGALVVSLWSADGEDVWAASSGTYTGQGLYRRIQGTWTQVSPGAWGPLWGSSPSSIWAYSYSECGGLCFWDGGSWGTQLAMPQGFATGLSGNGTVLPWAVGTSANAGAATWRLDGGTWELVPNPYSQNNLGANLYAVWPSTANDVWVVGGDPSVMHWDGSVWTFVSSTLAVGQYGVAGTAPDDVWTVGTRALHWDGTAWTDYGPAPARAVWGDARDDYWAPTGQGVIHWDGTRWNFPGPGGATGGTCIWGTSATDIRIGGPAGAVLRYRP